VEGWDAFVVLLALSLLMTRLDADPGMDDGPDFIVVVLDLSPSLLVTLGVNPFSSLIVLYVLILGFSVPFFFVVVVLSS